jgi:hypothetical protein
MNCGCFGRTHAGEDAQGLTYAQFEKAYETLLRKLISADWNSIDRRNYIREVADLVDTYPAFEARYDAEIETR